MDKNKVYELCQSIPAKYGIDPKVAYAVIMTESSGNEWTVRYEANNIWTYFPQRFYKPLNITLETEKVLQDTSYGLFQIMGSTARFMGFKSILTKLFQIDLNFHYGLSYLKSQLKKYNDDVLSAVAAYNAGSAKKVTKPDGTKEFVNQAHVNRFLDHYREIES